MTECEFVHILNSYKILNDFNNYNSFISGLQQEPINHTCVVAMVSTVDCFHLAAHNLWEFPVIKI